MPNSQQPSPEVAAIHLLGALAPNAPEDTVVALRPDGRILVAPAARADAMAARILTTRVALRADHNTVALTDIDYLDRLAADLTDLITTTTAVHAA